VGSNRSIEDLIAHEVVHQWFGNDVTEKSFAHLWLSEGFATYLAHYYIFQRYGRDSFVKRMKEDREEIIRFSKRWNRPVVDSVSAPMDLLNVNSYQRGSWILHRLHIISGPETFRKIIQKYFNTYKGGNANTSDFRKIAEEVTGNDLSAFFNLWAYQPLILKMEADWSYKNNSVSMNIISNLKLLRNAVLQMKLRLKYPDGRIYDEQILIPAEGLKDYQIQSPYGVPAEIILDPETELLFEGKIRKKG
jgi:aminopeptidase N